MELKGLSILPRWNMRLCGRSEYIEAKPSKTDGAALKNFNREAPYLFSLKTLVAKDYAGGSIKNLGGGKFG